jgi:phage terminase large subunit-like protein
MTCDPRWATPRTPERPTLGGAAAKIAAQLGTPLMPWQQQVADVALEVDPVTKAFAYRDVVLTVPRQSGKTQLLLVLVLARALMAPQQQVRYTAQTGADARKKLIDDWLPVLNGSAFCGQYRVRLTNGHEALIFTNGSHVGLVATTRKTGHGGSIDLGILDEAFAHPDARLEQALKPAMITRSQPQMWVVSTAGTPDESPYLWSKVETGRQLAEQGINTGVAYFEWSAEDDADPSDPATWRSCMPALGHTISESAVAADFASMPLSEFRRAYLNSWVTMSAEPVVPIDVWLALADPRSSAGDPVALAFDVSPDRSHAAIACAGKRKDGLIHVEVVDHRRGTNWVVDRVAQLVRVHRPVGVWCDPAGPAGSLIPELTAQRLKRSFTVDAREMTQACGVFFDAVTQGRLRHLGTPELVTALDGASRRQLADSWAWSRKSSSVDISPLVAVTLALWGLGAAPPRQPRVW